MMRILVAISGASGVIMGIRLLEQLRGRTDLHLIITTTARQIITMETDYEVCISPEQNEKFINLKKQFGINYTLSTELTTKLPNVEIHHKEPLSKVGSLERP